MRGLCANRRADGANRNQRFRCERFRANYTAHTRGFPTKSARGMVHCANGTDGFQREAVKSGKLDGKVAVVTGCPTIPPGSPPRSSGRSGDEVDRTQSPWRGLSRPRRWRRARNARQRKVSGGGACFDRPPARTKATDGSPETHSAEIGPRCGLPRSSRHARICAG